MLNLYVVKPESALCPACRKVHELQVLKIPWTETDEHSEKPTEWVFCGRTASMFPYRRLTMPYEADSLASHMTEETCVAQ